MTPEDVHLGRAEQKRQHRDQTLASAYADHPERFVKGHPKTRPVPREVWINKPADPESVG